MAPITIADLAAAFVDARTAASLTAVFPSASVPPKTCRYCGKYWLSWAGTHLNGHARCAVSLDFQRAVLTLYRSSPATVKQIAEVCGVSASNVAAWMRCADRGVR